MSETKTGWNRPAQPQTTKSAPRIGKPSPLRGAIAGVIAAALAGGALWYFIGKSSEATVRANTTKRSSRAVMSRLPSNGESTKPTAINEHTPSLPIPKISNERVESRDTIPAPQPLEEMEAALTNKPPKRKVAFKNGAEQLIALATPSEPGVPVPPLPMITEESVAKDVEKAMKHVITAEEGDSEDLLEKKMVVAAAKEEFQELREKEGWGFAEYVNALRDKANADAEFLHEAHKIADEIYHDKNISDDDYIKYRDQLNEKLRERGLPEIDKEDEPEKE